MAHEIKFAGAIWTNHARERLGQRGLSQSLAASAFTHPDRRIDGKEAGTYEFQKRVGKSLITIIAKQNEKYEWIILSCWIDPPLPGSIDIIKKQRWQQYQKAGFWGKLWLTLLRQLGL